MLVSVMLCVRGLQCARQVMSEWSDLVMAFGQSDEFSFLLPASSPLYGRRSAKLSTSFVSLFSSRYLFTVGVVLHFGRCVCGDSEACTTAVVVDASEARGPPSISMVDYVCAAILKRGPLSLAVAVVVMHK